MNDELYIGWQSHAPSRIGAYVRRVVLVLLLVAVGVALALVLCQRTISVAVFEWGKVKTFSGILRTQPYPHLLVPRPALTQGQVSSYYLVAPFKFGLKAETIAPLDGQFVTLKGTLIYRGNQTMIEAQPESLKTAENPNGKGSPPTPVQPVNLGRQTLVGEIVDSKCFLGVMNPGRSAPHRACAVRCISGGIPPVLLVRQAEGPPLYFLLVSAQGRPVNKEVLDMIAEPIEITGEITRQGDLLFLRSDPASYRRVRN